MPDTRTPNEIGEDLEQRVQDIMQGERVPGSGSGKWYKLDVRDGLSIIWSCKGQKRDKSAFRVTADLMREIKRAVSGMRGQGDMLKGGLVFEIEGKEAMVMWLEDFKDIATADPSEMPLLRASKAQERRQRTRRTKL